MKHFTKLATAAALGTVLGTAAIAQELYTPNLSLIHI